VKRPTQTLDALLHGRHPEAGQHLRRIKAHAIVANSPHELALLLPHLDANRAHTCGVFGDVVQGFLHHAGQHQLLKGRQRGQ
jgi:hypothetical protein